MGKNLLSIHGEAPHQSVVFGRVEIGWRMESGSVVPNDQIACFPLVSVHKGLLGDVFHVIGHNRFARDFLSCLQTVNFRYMTVRNIQRWHPSCRMDSNQWPDHRRSRFEHFLGKRWTRWIFFSQKLVEVVIVMDLSYEAVQEGETGCVIKPRHAKFTQKWTYSNKSFKFTLLSIR